MGFVLWSNDAGLGVAEVGTIGSRVMRRLDVTWVVTTCTFLSYCLPHLRQ
jgi:hypothetical protein